MGKRVVGVFLLLLYFLLTRALPLEAQSADAKTLLGEAAKAMGGVQALRALKNQVVESEGKQFDFSSTPRPAAQRAR